MSEQAEPQPIPEKKTKRTRTPSARCKWIGTQIRNRPEGMGAREAMKMYSQEAKLGKWKSA